MFSHRFNRGQYSHRLGTDLRPPRRAHAPPGAHTARKSPSVLTYATPSWPAATLGSRGTNGLRSWRLEEWPECSVKSAHQPFQVSRQSPRPIPGSRWYRCAPRGSVAIATGTDGSILIPALRVGTHRAVQPWVQLCHAEVGDRKATPAKRNRIGAGFFVICDLNRQAFSSARQVAVRTTSSSSILCRAPTRSVFNRCRFRGCQNPVAAGCPPSTEHEAFVLERRSPKIQQQPQPAAADREVV